MASISIKCVRGEADKEADPIIDGMLTSQSSAVSRGKRFLDDPSQGGYYLVKQRNIKTPHKNDSVVPGSWITVTDSKLGLANTKLKVKSYTINIDVASGVSADIATEQYLEVAL